MVSKTAFGALPIQRITFEESGSILRKAYESGINFFDTANGYTDSEEKIGQALSDVREQIIIATKSALLDKDRMLENIETSLKRMKTEYIDIFQIHNPAQMPSEEIYEALLEQKEKGRIRHIGITNHRINLAFEAVRTGWFETMQFPFSLLSGPQEIDLVNECQRTDTGFIAMKAMSGGLINNSTAAFGFMMQYENVVPIYGIQRMSELEEFLALEMDPPQIDDHLAALIEKSREGLAGDFCRSCGYCLPCPADIDIPQCARVSLLMTRAPYQPFLSDAWRAKMEKVHDCIDCGSCKTKCPYGLDVPNLLKREAGRYHALCETLS
jgi:aryl-alcohol dehydrogenase-like predicted oxidoreductase